MAVHAKPEPASLAFKLSKAFRIDLRNAEICVQKTAVTEDDLRTMMELAGNRDKPTVEQKATRRASCTLACCAQSQGTMRGNKIELEALQMQLDKSTMPAHWIRRVNNIMILCNDEVKSIIDECDVTFAFIMCLARETDKLEVK